MRDPLVNKLLRAELQKSFEEVRSHVTLCRRAIIKFAEREKKMILFQGMAEASFIERQLTWLQEDHLVASSS